MDFLSHYRRKATLAITLLVVLHSAVLIALTWQLQRSGDMSGTLTLVAVGSVGFVLAIVWGNLVGHITMQPIEKVWQAIQHTAPHGETQPAPDLSTLSYGKELVSNLVNHVYQLASVVDSVEKTNSRKAQDLHASFIANALPLPLVVCDKDDQIVYANGAASKYFDAAASDIEGNNLYTTFDMSFSDDQTLHNWLGKVRRSQVTANATWERVRIGLPGQKETQQFDLAAHYNQANPLGYEVILVLFDHTEVYSQDDQAMSFVALTVHELRTPLTLLKGYIEVFDDELGPTLTPELQGFMKKMNASAQQLTAFVDNILNVAKIEDNQLTLQLHEEKWEDVLRTVVNDLRLRASVRGVTIQATLSRDLPTVAVDRYSIYEVIANLLDNAIKYTGSSREIHLSASLNANGLVETKISDFGVGIDATVLPHIFDKFYRNHRNRAQIGGTGLGLYLSRAIVQAHGGQISVSSKVNEGSTFTFTVLPYNKLDEVGKAPGAPGGVTRGAHGWIRNHSLYRD